MKNLNKKKRSNMNKHKILFLLSCATLFFAGCKTIKQPESVSQPLNYSDAEIVQNEISTIKNMLSTDCTRALWRACLLDDAELKTECANFVLLQLDEAVENKNYHEASRLYESLLACGFPVNEKFSDYNFHELILKELPGITVEEDKLPKNIDDCVNGTVTVWVDKGFKVQNGAGFADVVIGSGFFIDKRGYLITNHHVIADHVDPKYEGYSRVYVKLPSDMETRIPAKVIGYDPIIDLALLKVEYEPEFVFALGSSSELSVGTKVSAIGTPLGLEGTLTSGIISKTDRKLTTMGNVFQLDAAVNSGNSGGPLIDENRRVQAIVFAGMLRYQGLNFAIPVEYLKQELPLLSKGGELNHVWIGAFGRTKKEKGKQIGLEVQYVMPGGSASFSGIKEGDVITGINGQKIKSLDELQYALMAYDANTIISFSYINAEGLEISTPVFLEKRPGSPYEEIYKSDLITDSFWPLYGVKLIHSSTINRKSYTIKEVLNGSVADEMGFSENDPITIQEVKFDHENNAILTRVTIQRRKKGYIDVTLNLGAYLDSPYYF